MGNIISLLRVHQWIKNGFILFPLIFSGHFRESDQVVSVVIALFAFCCVASSVYVFNDLLDYQRDRLHPKKKHRPLSSGVISPLVALCFALPLLALGVAISFWVNTGVGGLVLGYVALHILYNLWAKNVVILDVFFIAFGFQIRIWVGSLAIGVMPSEWLQMCVFVLSLFLGFTKRRSELSALKEKAVEHRQALLEYNLYLLDQIIMIASTLTIVFYGLYTISQDIMMRLGNYHMVYSLGFVIFGVFRYLYLVHVKKLGDEPGELVLRDFPLVINVLLWLVYIAVVFYVL